MYFANRNVALAEQKKNVNKIVMPTKRIPDNPNDFIALYCIFTIDMRVEQSIKLEIFAVHIFWPHNYVFVLDLF